LALEICSIDEILGVFLQFPQFRWASVIHGSRSFLRAEPSM
jgi:hypothetical protein